MEEIFDDFFNINQLLMKQDRDMASQNSSTQSGSDSNESNHQQNNEGSDIRDSQSEAEEENQNAIHGMQSRELYIEEKRQITV